MSEMIFASKSHFTRALLSRFVTRRRRDYIGAGNAGLNALLLRRKGKDGEEVQKGAGTDLGTLKSSDVVEDLYGVLRWVDKINKMHKEYDEYP
jgi:hypothetical protein